MTRLRLAMAVSMAVAILSLASTMTLGLIGFESYLDGGGFAQPFDGALGYWLWLSAAVLCLSYFVFDSIWRKVDQP